MSNLSATIKSIQDIMRKDAGTYGDAQRLEQLGPRRRHPAPTDRVTVDGETYGIVSIGKTSPAGTPVLYDLHLRK